VKIAATEDGRKLIYKRQFFFGGKDTVTFPAANYNALKQLFEMIHNNDNHTITLKQAAATASN
jgi:hypothetical protein